MRVEDAHELAYGALPRVRGARFAPLRPPAKPPIGAQSLP